MNKNKEKRYNNWINQQILALKNFKIEIKDKNYLIDFKKDLPFKVSIPLEENAREPEYVSQFLFKQKLDKSGLWIEAGVWRGEMINRMAKANPDKIMYGFDSFEGFPVDGRKEGDWNFKPFNLKGKIPTATINGEILVSNIQLIKGWFRDTLTPFLKEQNQKISYIVIDCDIYSSTVDVLESIKDYITNETIIVFDDMWHYDGFEDHQSKALYEFVSKYNYETKWIAYRGEMFDFSKMDERRGEEWNWKNQWRWRRNNNYSDCALFLVK